jgi:hypothetical protein
MAGVRYNLTQETVRAALVGERPNRINQYWIEVDGVAWPVKQALGIATGAAVPQSQFAQRQLKAMGFVVHGDAVPRESDGRRGPTRSATFVLDELEVIDHIDVRVSFDWHRAGEVTLDAIGLPKFPSNLPNQPGLYRFDFGLDNTGNRRYYIGESKNLEQRASNYANAKKDGGRNRTSRRIHKEVIQHLSDGGSIEFAITTAARVEGETVDLRRKSARCVAENAAVLLAQTTPRTLALNIDAELGEEDVHA